MKSHKHSAAGPDADTENAHPNLQTMSDLYCVDLSALLQEMEKAGIVRPEADGDALIFHIPICPQHRLAILPVCLLCDEQSRA